MRKQRPTRTGTVRKKQSSRKGKKLVGLTPFEARQRAVKGWATRRARGLAPMKAQGKRPKYGVDDDEHDMSIKNIFGHDVGINIEGKSEWQQRVAEEAKNYADYGESSKEFSDLIRDLPEEEKARFVASVRSYQERKRRIGQIAKDQDPYLEPVSDPTAQIRKTGRQRLHALIAQDARSPAQIHILTEDPELTETANLADLDTGDMRKERLRAPIAVPVTRKQLREQAIRAVTETFEVPDPIEHRPMSVFKRKDRDEFIDAVIQSHFGETPIERHKAINRARSMASKMTKDASIEVAKRHEVAAAHRIETAGARRGYATSPHETGVYPNKAALEKVAPKVRDWEAKRHKLRQEEKALEQTLRKPKNQKEFIKLTQQLRKNRDEQEGLIRDITDFHEATRQIKSQSNPDLMRARAKEITAAGRNPYGSLPREERLGGSATGDLTAAEYYDMYGHETSAPPFAHIRGQLDRRAAIRQLEKERDRKLEAVDRRGAGYKKLADAAGESPASSEGEKVKQLIHSQHERAIAKLKSEAIPPPLSRLRAHQAFTRAQTTAKVKALREGTYTAGWNGTTRTGDLDKAIFRVSPNLKWRYKLRNKENPERIDIQELPYWDKKTKHEVGKRNHRNQLYPGQQDQMIEEEKVRRLDNAFNLTAGKRSHVQTGRILKPYQEEVFIPMHGVTESTRRVKHPTEKFQQKQIQKSDGQWVPAESDIEWEIAPKERRRTEPVPKEMLVTFTDPKNLQIRTGERDNLAIVVPRLRRGHAEGDHMLTVHPTTGLPIRPAFHASRAVGEDRVFEVDLNRIGRGNLGKAAHTYKSAQRETQLRRASENAAWERTRNMGLAPDQREGEQRAPLKEIAAAGGYAAYYASKTRVRKGYAPRIFNDTFVKLQNSNVHVRNFARSKGIADKRLGDPETIDRLTRPLLSHVADAKFRLMHPFSDPSGSVFGIEYGSVRLREGKISKWIPLDTAERARRELQRDMGHVERVLRAEKFIEKNQYRGGVLGRLARHRAEPMKRWKDYSTFYNEPVHGQDPGLLMNALGKARQVRDTVRSDTKAFEDATAAIKQLEEVRAVNMAKQSKSKELVPAGFWGPVQHPNLARKNRYHLGRHSIDKGDAALIGGGLAVTALGAHYLYHRHQEKKRREADPTYAGTKYYNKLIPGRRDITVPVVRNTGKYRIPTNNLTYEFGLANRQVPVRFGVAPEKRTIWKGSPADRGYESNAPIIGGVRRGNVKGGSKMESMFFDMAMTGATGRGYKREGAQLIFRGKKLPIVANIGARKNINLSATNPRRLTLDQRRDLAWAFGDTVDEGRMRQFFSPTDPVHDILDNPNEMLKIRRSKKDAKLDRVAVQEIGFTGDDEGGRRVGRTGRLVPRAYAAPSVVRTADEKGTGAFGIPFALKGADKDKDYLGDTYYYNSAAYEKKFATSRGTQMATGGTGGVEPQTQIGVKQRKHEERVVGRRPDTPAKPRGRVIKQTDIGIDPNANIPAESGPRGKRRGAPITESFRRGIGETRDTSETLEFKQPFNPKKPPPGKKKK